MQFEFLVHLRKIRFPCLLKYIFVTRVCVFPSLLLHLNVTPFGLGHVFLLLSFLVKWIPPPLPLFSLKFAAKWERLVWQWFANWVEWNAFKGYTITKSPQQSTFSASSKNGGTHRTTNISGERKWWFRSCWANDSKWYNQNKNQGLAKRVFQKPCNSSGSRKNGLVLVFKWFVTSLPSRYNSYSNCAREAFGYLCVSNWRWLYAEFQCYAYFCKWQ